MMPTTLISLVFYFPLYFKNTFHTQNQRQLCLYIVRSDKWDTDIDIVRAYTLSEPSPKGPAVLLLIKPSFKKQPS